MKFRRAAISAIIIVLVIALSLLAIRLFPAGLRFWNSSSTHEALKVWSPHGLSPSDRIVYKIGYESDSSFDFSSLFKAQETSQEKMEKAPGLTQSLYTSIRGEMVGTVIEKKGDTLLIAYRLDSHVVTLSINGQKAIEQAQAVRNDLYKEVYVIMNSMGRIQSLRFDPSIANRSKGYFQALLAMVQFVFAEKGTPDLMEWEVKEEDLGGSYVAHYQQDSLPSKTEGAEKNTFLKNFRKTKIRYLSSAKKRRPGEPQPQKTIPSEGNLMAIFDFRAGHLLSLNGSELLTIRFGRKELGQVRNFIQLSFIATGPIEGKGFSLLRKASANIERSVEAVSLSTDLSEKEGVISLHRRNLGEATLESLLTDLSAAEATGGKHPVQLLHKFEALIYLYPESCGRIGKILAKADPKSLTMNILASALVAIGHKQAQAALISATKARKEDVQVLFVLIPALGGVVEPTLETEKALRVFAFESTNPDMRATAELALGSAARSLTVTSPDRAGKIIKEFVKKLESPSSEKELQQTLHVLGNTGSTLTQSTIEKYLTHPAPFIRAAAMFALRWIESSKVDSLLAEGIISDQDRSVRLEAANALRLREMTLETCQAQKEAFMKDAAVEVRVAVLHNLANALEDFPEIKKLVKEAAAKDSSKDVRKLANDIMARWQKE